MDQHQHKMSHGMSMKNYFHYGFESPFLFQDLNIDSCIKLWTVCGVLFLLTILYEFIKYVRSVHCGCRAGKTNCSGENGDLQDNDTGVRLARNCYVGRLRSRKHKLIQTLLHTTQTILGFIIMLAVMSFNLCLIFAIVVGAAVGYYIFYRPYNEIEAIDSCH